MIKIITNCPTCDATLVRINSQIFCQNKSCDAQIFKKLTHFAKVMKIKGLGEKTLEKLPVESIEDIYTLPVETLIILLGDKVGLKLFTEIQHSRQADLATILESFSIPLLGNTAAVKICEIVDHIDDISEETCKQAGLGAKVTANLISYLDENFLQVSNLPFSYKSTKKEKQVFSKTVVITGKLNKYPSRNLAQEYLESIGFRVSESVTKNTDYLIDDEGIASTKRTKAENYKINVVTFEELLIKENIK